MVWIKRTGLFFLFVAIEGTIRAIIIFALAVPRLSLTATAIYNADGAILLVLFAWYIGYFRSVTCQFPCHSEMREE